MTRATGTGVPGRILKERMKKGDVVVGIGAEELGTPVVGKLLAKAGFDWIHFEWEHIQVNPETFFNFVALSNGEGVPVIVKAPELSRERVSRTMDAGAAGIRLPWTETGEQVEKLVGWVKYPPVGTRAIYFGANAAYQDIEDPKQYIKDANASTIVMPHVETARAIENIDEIASIKHVDAIIVGPYDLSISLGAPGDFGQPKFLAAVDKVIKACQKYGVAPGMTVGSFEDGRRWIEKGMTCIECSSDRDLLFNGAKALVAQYQTYLKGARKSGL